jgi:hypothetical protein
MLFKRTNNKLSVEINKLKLLCVTTSSIAMLAFTDAQAAALWDQITNARLKLNKPKEITNNLLKPSQDNKFFNYDMLNNSIIILMQMILTRTILTGMILIGIMILMRVLEVTIIVPFLTTNTLTL